VVYQALLDALATFSDRCDHSRQGGEVGGEGEAYSYDCMGLYSVLQLLKVNIFRLKVGAPPRLLYISIIIIIY
jgi:hypothetical protein